MRMKFGICTPSKNYEAAAKIGYDFIELPGTELALMSAGEFANLRARVQETGLPVVSLNAIFTPEQKILGPQPTPWAELCAFFGTMVRRAGLLGVKQFGIGGGFARDIPEGFDWAAAAAQYIAFVRLLSDMAQKAGIGVSIEYLRAAETNFITDFDQAKAMHDAVDRANVGLLVDAYHSAFDVAPGNVLRAGARLWHCHVACPEGRYWPRREDGTDYAPFLRAIEQNGRPGRVSIEGNAPGEFGPAAVEALAVLKAAARQ
jgi:sugar phosphate isomerase/epimerase